MHGVYLFTSVGMAGPKGAQTRFVVINMSILYTPMFIFSITVRLLMVILNLNRVCMWENVILYIWPGGGEGGGGGIISFGYSCTYSKSKRRDVTYL